MAFFENKTILALFVSIIGCSGMNDYSASEYFDDPKVRQLSEAACEGNLETVSQMLSDGASPNFSGRQGITPLIWTLRCENHTGVEALLKAGADPNAAADRFLIPLAVAAVVEDHRFTQLLLDAGADVNGLTDSVDSSPLMRAFSLGAQKEYWDNYDLILDRGADINLAYGPNRRTIADRAVASGRYQLVVDLLEKGYRKDLPGLKAAAELFRHGGGEQAPHKERLFALLDELMEVEPN